MALAPRVAKVVAVEKDRPLASSCGLRIVDCGLGNVEVVEGDALRLDWHTLIELNPATPQSAIRNPQSKLVGNIPSPATPLNPKPASQERRHHPLRHRPAADR